MAPTTTYPPPLAEPEHRRQRLKVGAVCGKAARPDLCGGREVTRVPTATIDVTSAVVQVFGRRQRRPKDMRPHRVVNLMEALRRSVAEEAAVPRKRTAGQAQNQ